MSIRQATLPANAAASLPAGTLLQRKCACGSHTSGEEECDQCKRMQRRAASADGDEFEIPPIVGTVLASPGRPLDAQVRQQMEAGFGHDFHDVRVHTDATAQRSARSVNALAYTVGRNVVFGGGQYQPGSQHGMHLLAHELAHVVQQRGHGGGAGAVGRSHALMEYEADSAADRIVRGQPVPTMQRSPNALLARQVAPPQPQPIRTLGPCKPRKADLQLHGLPAAPDQPGRSDRSERKTVSKDGHKYIVERSPWSQTGKGAITKLEAKPGIDAEQVWLQIEWCRGDKEGTVRAAANLPEAALKLVRDAIANRGDINAAWKLTSFRPTVSVTVRTGTLDLSIGGNLTVDSDGKVKGGGVDLGLTPGSSSRRYGVNLDINKDESGNLGVNGFFWIKWGAAPKAPLRCEKEWSRSGYDFLCYSVEDVPGPSLVGDQRVDVRDELNYNLFFEHAQDRVLPVADRQEFAKLQTALKSNFQIQSIEGWTSPEGPMGPHGGPEPAGPPEGKLGTTFRNNSELSRRRAEAARQWVHDNVCQTNPACIVPGAPIAGMGERMDPVDPISGERQDIGGAELEQHVDSHFAADPAEASVRTPAMLEELSRITSRKQRVEKIYRKLRRATLHLRRTTTASQECTFQGPSSSKEVPIGKCQKDIRRLAYPDEPGDL